MLTPGSCYTEVCSGDSVQLASRADDDTFRGLNKPQGKGCSGPRVTIWPAEPAWCPGGCDLQTPWWAVSAPPLLGTDGGKAMAIGLAQVLLVALDGLFDAQ